VLGLFMLLSLEGGVARFVRVLAGLLLVLGWITTKSNGPLFALAAGFATWGWMRARELDLPASRLAGSACLALALVAVPAWLVSETGWGGTWVQAIAQRTVLARIEHSSEGRERIWHRLQHSLASSPLGIGPANSSEQEVEIGERERKSTLDAKEAHSDYVSYAVERGPLGFAGLLAGIVVLGVRVLRRRPDEVGASRAVRAACAGAFVALLVESTVIEQLHFRHLWWFLAWMWSATAASGAAA